jgi:HSP20 family protein
MPFNDLTPWNWFKRKAITEDRSRVLTYPDRDLDVGYGDFAKNTSKLPSRFQCPPNKNGVCLDPKLSFADLKKHYEITFDLPGIKEGGIAIVLKNDIISIKGERKYYKKILGIKRKLTIEKFERSFLVPKNVNLEKISAVYADPVLTIRLLKQKIAKDNSIKIPLVIKQKPGK